MSRVTEVLVSLGIPFKEDGYEPKKPPSGPAYAVVTEVDQDDGPDGCVGFRRVSALVELYDAGTPKGREARQALHEALSDANLKHVKERTIYFKDEKVFETDYDIDTYIEKRSIR